MEQRGKELEDVNMEQVVRERCRMEDGDKGDGGWKVDKGWKTEGWSDEGCLQNKEHEIDAEASQSLKGNQNKRT